MEFFFFFEHCFGNNPSSRREFITYSRPYSNLVKSEKPELLPTPRASDLFMPGNIMDITMKISNGTMFIIWELYLFSL